MKILFTFYLLLFTYLLQAQVINLSYDKQRILLGEQIGVTIKAFIQKGQVIDSFPIDTLPHFEVMERSKIDTAVAGETLQLSQTIIITSWDSGRWNLPTIIRAGKPYNPVAIDVAFTSPWNPDQPYHDIKGIVPVKNPGKSTWWWYVIGLAVIIVLFLLFFPEGRKEKGEIELDKTAYKKALQQLEKLERERPDDAKNFYTELITIFRGYLKGAKGIQSYSKTTDDLSLQLQAQKMPPEEYKALVQTLRLSDLVKFAAYKPHGQMNTEALTIIKQSITILEHGNAV